MNILLIEDDASLNEMVCDLLRAQGYRVESALDGETGLAYTITQGYDLVILDRMLPKLDGIQILKTMRSKEIEVPVLLLTALDSDADIAAGLDAGADDYLPKPFAAPVLLARVRALLRRPAKLTSGHTLYCGDLSLDTATNLLTGPKGNCRCSRKESEMLAFLMRNYQKAVTREIILTRVWGVDAQIDDGNVGNFIYFVRKRLQEVGSRLAIHTLHGVGYQLGG